MKWNEVPKFVEYGLTTPTNYVLLGYIDYIEREITKYGLEMNPDFQRGHVWTEVQQSKWIEFILKGGRSARDFYFNWSSKTDEYVCVDGLQRTVALQNFIHNKLKAFGQFFDEFEFPRAVICEPPMAEYEFHVYINHLKTKKEVLQWYVDMNAGGTPHTSKEIEKVKNMIEEIEVI